MATSSKLEVQDLPDPRAGPGEIKVRMAGAGVNPVDWKIRSGALHAESHAAAFMYPAGMVSNAGQPYVVEQLSGNLVALRGGTFRTVSEWTALSDSLGVVATRAKPPIVLCADHRRLEVMGEDVTAAVVDSFRHFNSKIARSAVLLPANASILRLQMERIIRQANHPMRRAVVDAAEAKAWLSSLIDERQQARLDEFLAFPTLADSRSR